MQLPATRTLEQSGLTAESDGPAGSGARPGGDYKDFREALGRREDTAVCDL